MRLDEREIWEFTAGDTFSTLVPLGVGAVSAAVIMVGNPNNHPWLVMGASLVGIGVFAYVAVDWLGRLSAAVDAARRRAAETAAITPAYLAIHAEIELTEARRRLVEAVSQMGADQLAYGRELMDASGITADGDTGRATWRIAGHEFPVVYASEWLERLGDGDRLPSDSDWGPPVAMPRAAWRQLASAMAEALRGQGVAQYAGGSMPPRWTTRDLLQRQAALNHTMVYAAHQIAEAMYGKREEIEP